MMEGIVRSVVTSKGTFGFIRTGNSADLFFHKDDFLGDWNTLVDDFGDDKSIRVEFEKDKTPKGPRARNVRRLDEQ